MNKMYVLIMLLISYSCLYKGGFRDWRKIQDKQHINFCTSFHSLFPYIYYLAFSLVFLNRLFFSLVFITLFLYLCLSNVLLSVSHLLRYSSPCFFCIYHLVLFSVFITSLFFLCIYHIFFTVSITFLFFSLYLSLPCLFFSYPLYLLSRFFSISMTYYVSPLYFSLQLSHPCSLPYIYFLVFSLYLSHLCSFLYIYYQHISSCSLPCLYHLCLSPLCSFPYIYHLVLCLFFTTCASHLHVLFLIFITTLFPAIYLSHISITSMSFPLYLSLPWSMPCIHHFTNCAWIVKRHKVENLIEIWLQKDSNN